MEVSGTTVSKRVKAYMDKGLTYEEAMKKVMSGQKASKSKKKKKMKSSWKDYIMSAVTGKPGHSFAGRMHLHKKRWSKVK